MYDPDGVNPYGRELAAQLVEAGYDVTAVVPVDAEWRPDGVTVRAVLPANRSAGSVARQAFRLLRGLLLVARLAVSSDAQWVVAWTRTPYEESVLTLVARRRRVHVVVHNPGPRDVGGRALRRAAATRVVHAATPAVPDGVVCAHPLYVHWLRWAAPPASPPHDTLRLLVLGHRRADKNDAALPAILAALPGDVRDRVEVVVCGKGRLTADLGVRVDDRTSDDFVPDRDLAAALVSCDALLAPYTGATQSGTVALAVTARLPVVGYDSGAIADLAGSDGLVPAGDAAALAARIACVPTLPKPHADAAATVRDWKRVLG